jgi:hypothetical protein
MTTTSVRRRVGTVVAAGAMVGAIAGAGLAAAPASAGHRDGVCEVGEFCLFRTSGSPRVLDLFYCASNITGRWESYWNRDTYTWYVYKTDGQRGSIAPGARGNFFPSAANVRSACWYL